MHTPQAVHLVFFSVQGYSFGVSAGQVTEFVNADSRPRPADEQMNSEWTMSYKGRELRVIQFSRRLRLQEDLKDNRSFLHRQDLPQPGDVGNVVDEGSVVLEPLSKILVVRHRREGELGVYVEFLKELSLVPLTQIVRLPLIMETKKQLQSVWGLVLIDGRPIVLVDLEQI